MPKYDIGKIVRDYIDGIVGVSPNLATPATWIDVLDFLHRLTTKLEDADKFRVLKKGAMDTPGGVLTGPPPKDQLSIDLERWRARLDYYMLVAHSAKDDQDRNAVLWEVTAPMLYGWVGGITGDEVLLPSGGYPDDFDTKARHAPDIATPYSLANQLDVFEDWERKRVQLIATDMRDSAEALVPDVPRPKGVPWWAWMAAGAGALIVLRKS